MSPLRHVAKPALSSSSAPAHRLCLRVLPFGFTRWCRYWCRLLIQKGRILSFYSKDRAEAGVTGWAANYAFYEHLKEGWRRRVGVEPTNPLLAGSLVLKTRRATGPIPPPRSVRIAEGVRCCPAISAALRLGLQRIAVGVSIDLTTRASLSPDLTFDTMR